MEFEKVEIEGLILCKPKLINDSRGFFSEVFRKDLLESILEKKINFCQSNTSESKYGTIRGLVTMEDIIETILGLEIVDETDLVVDLQALARKKRKTMKNKKPPKK